MSVNVNKIAPLMALAALTLAACQTNSVPVDALATELAQLDKTATPAGTPTPSIPPTPTPTPLPSLSIKDPTGDCVTAAFLPVDCSVLQRDLTQVDLTSDGRSLTVTLTTEGEPWEQFPPQFVSLKFDSDRDSTTGSRTLGIEHGLGTDTNLFWGWTSDTGLPFGIEQYDAVGTLTDTIGERDQIAMVVDDHTLRFEVRIPAIGSSTFNFVVSLEGAPGAGVFDYVPEPGSALSFPSGELTGDTQ